MNVRQLAEQLNTALCELNELPDNDPVQTFLHYDQDGYQMSIETLKITVLEFEINAEDVSE